MLIYLALLEGDTVPPGSCSCSCFCSCSALPGLCLGCHALLPVALFLSAVRGWGVRSSQILQHAALQSVGSGEKTNRGARGEIFLKDKGTHRAPLQEGLQCRGRSWTGSLSRNSLRVSRNSATFRFHTARLVTGTARVPV